MFQDHAFSLQVGSAICASLSALSRLTKWFAECNAWVGQFARRQAAERILLRMLRLKQRLYCIVGDPDRLAVERDPRLVAERRNQTRGYSRVE